MTRLTRRARQSMPDRVCFVCGKRIPERGGVFHADLGILVHQGACADRVHAERRVYDRSPRGRWRRAAEVLARVAAGSESAA